MITGHFTIDGAFITSHCRHLWSEGRAAEALRFLVEGLEGISEEIALLVCTGKKKLIGRDAEIGLADDDVQMDDRGVRLPSALEIFMRKDHKVEQAEKNINAVLGIYSEAEEKWGFPPVGKIQRGRMQIAWDRKKQDFTQQKDVQRLLETRVVEMRGRTMSGSDTPPEPDRELGSKTGWLSPDGLLYPCHYRGHHRLAVRLGKDEYTLESQGWIKLQEEQWLPLDVSRPVTQRQFDTISAWSHRHKIQIERWIKTE